MKHKSINFGAIQFIYFFFHSLWFWGHIYKLVSWDQWSLFQSKKQNSSNKSFSLPKKQVWKFKVVVFFFFRVLLIIHTRKPTWVIPYGKGYSSVLWTSVIIISSCWQLVQPKCTDRIARPFQDLTVQSLFFCIMITYVFLTINSQKQNLKKCCTFTFWQKKRKNPFNCWQTILYFSF